MIFSNVDWVGVIVSFLPPNGYALWGVLNKAFSKQYRLKWGGASARAILWEHSGDPESLALYPEWSDADRLYAFFTAGLRRPLNARGWANMVRFSYHIPTLDFEVLLSSCARERPSLDIWERILNWGKDPHIHWKEPEVVETLWTHAFISTGDYHSLTMVFSKKAHWCSSCLPLVLQRRSLPLVQWTFEFFQSYMRAWYTRADIWNLVLKSRDFVIIRWCVENLFHGVVPSGGQWSSAVQILIEKGNRDCEVLWMYHNGAIYVPSDFTTMVKNERWVLMRWVIRHEMGTDVSACAHAAKKGNLVLLKWLRSQGCPWCSWTATSAVGKGHLRVLKWAVENGCPVDWLTWRTAVLKKDPDTIGWLRSRQLDQV